MPGWDPHRRTVVLDHDGAVQTLTGPQARPRMHLDLDDADAADNLAGRRRRGGDLWFRRKGGQGR